MIKSITFKNFLNVQDGKFSFSAENINFLLDCKMQHEMVVKVIYCLLQTGAQKSFVDLEKRYGDKLLAVFRVPSLNHLVEKGAGNVCEISLEMENPDHDVTIAFSTKSKSKVEVIKRPTATIPFAPAYLPSQELITMCPWLMPLYDNHHIKLEETWRDTVSLLGKPCLKGDKEKIAKKLTDVIEKEIGKVVCDYRTGEFHLVDPSKGRLEMSLVPEGVRKLAMLVQLIRNDSLPSGGLLLWLHPETGMSTAQLALQRKILKLLTEHNVQVICASNSNTLSESFSLGQVKGLKII